MRELIAALWLGALLTACSTTKPSAASGTAPSEARLPCASPEPAGCAECCVEQAGPAANERACYRRRAAGHDYAEQAELRNLGPCPATCRPCAACTRDRQKSYQRLRAQGCDCSDSFVREIVVSIDPCYSPGCGCTCSQLARMSECGPPL